MLDSPFAGEAEFSISFSSPGCVGLWSFKDVCRIDSNLLISAWLNEGKRQHHEKGEENSQISSKVATEGWRYEELFKWETGRQSDRQTNRQTNGQTDRDRQTH